MTAEGVAPSAIRDVVIAGGGPGGVSAARVLGWMRGQVVVSYIGAEPTMVRSASASPVPTCMRWRGVSDTPPSALAADVYGHFTDAMAQRLADRMDEVLAR